jgi:hypothetical protein
LHSAKTGEPAFPKVYGMTAWEYRAAHPEESAIFDAAMTGLSLAEAEAVVRSYDFSGVGVLADVGGGKGALLAATLAANPALHGILFDQPTSSPARKTCSSGRVLQVVVRWLAAASLRRCPRGRTPTCSRASFTTGTTLRRSRYCARVALRWQTLGGSCW